MVGFKLTSRENIELKKINAMLGFEPPSREKNWISNLTSSPLAHLVNELYVINLIVSLTLKIHWDSIPRTSAFHKIIILKSLAYTYYFMLLKNQETISWFSIYIKKIQPIFGTENWLWKYNICNFQVLILKSDWQLQKSLCI